METTATKADETAVRITGNKTPASTRTNDPNHIRYGIESEAQCCFCTKTGRCCLFISALLITGLVVCYIYWGEIKPQLSDGKQTVLRIRPINQSSGSQGEIMARALMDECGLKLKSGVTINPAKSFIKNKTTEWKKICEEKDEILIFRRQSSTWDSMNQSWCGFGNFESSFWLGTSLIYNMTSDGGWDIKVTFETKTGEKIFYTYENFAIQYSHYGYEFSINGALPKTTNFENYAKKHRGDECMSRQSAEINTVSDLDILESRVFEDNVFEHLGYSGPRIKRSYLAGWGHKRIKRSPWGFGSLDDFSVNTDTKDEATGTTTSSADIAPTNATNDAANDAANVAIDNAENDGVDNAENDAVDSTAEDDRKASELEQEREESKGVVEESKGVVKVREESKGVAEESKGVVEENPITINETVTETTVAANKPVTKTTVAANANKENEDSNMNTIEVSEEDKEKKKGTVQVTEKEEKLEDESKLEPKEIPKGPKEIPKQKSVATFEHPYVSMTFCHGDCFCIDGIQICPMETTISLIKNQKQPQQQQQQQQQQHRQHEHEHEHEHEQEHEHEHEHEHAHEHKK